MKLITTYADGSVSTVQGDEEFINMAREANKNSKVEIVHEYQEYDNGNLYPNF